MALSSQSGLVAGATPATAATTRRVQLVRAMCMDGERQEPGAVLDVPRALAAELCAAGKAVRVQAPEAKAPAAAGKAAQGKSAATATATATNEKG